MGNYLSACKNTAITFINFRHSLNTKSAVEAINEPQSCVIEKWTKK